MALEEASEISVLPPVALGVASSSALLPPAFGLSLLLSSLVASVASFLGSFRSVIQEPDLSSVRLASIPTATSRGNTSLMRRHSHPADFGHALSRDTPRDSATSSSSL